MQVTRSKIIALAFALGYLATAVVMWGWDAGGLATISVCLLLPLGLIWFPDEVEAYTRKAADRDYSRMWPATPALVVTFVGWLFLVGYAPLLAYLLGSW
jgi:hypothetical protein